MFNKITIKLRPSQIIFMVKVKHNNNNTKPTFQKKQLVEVKQKTRIISSVRRKRTLNIEKLALYKLETLKN